MTATLEDLFTSPQAFALTTASPLQRAVCRVIDGLPLGELADHPDVIEAIGDVSALPVGSRPTEVDLLAGIRTGKSRLAACAGLHAARTVDLSGLATGEVPRVSIVSLKLDTARVVLDHLVGTIMAKPALRRLLIEDPKGETVLVKHPSGRPVEITCVAGSRAGGSLVARWSAGAIFDEFPRMVGSDDGAVINFDDARRAVLGRLLPGAQILAIGSPWAPFGPAYQRCEERWKKPTARHVVIRARAPALNPVWWTPARCDALREADLTAWTTDVMAEFADPSSAFIEAAEIKRATRVEPLVLPPRRGRLYIAACDPATRRNAWTLTVLAGYRDSEASPRFEVVLAREWVPRHGPLVPGAVLGEIRDVIAPYGLRSLLADQHSADANRDLANRVGLDLRIVTVGAGRSLGAHANRSEMYERLKGEFASGTIEIPAELPLQKDLASVRRRITATGITYDLPKTADGRHGDYVPALALALHGFPGADDVRAREAVREKASRMYRGLALRNEFGPEVEAAVRAEIVDERGSLWARLSRFNPPTQEN